MPARSVCLVALSLSEAGPGRFGRQVSVIDIYHTIPYQPKKMKWPSAKTNRGNTKEILQTKSGTLGELGTPHGGFSV